MGNNITYHGENTILMCNRTFFFSEVLWNESQSKLCLLQIKKKNTLQHSTQTTRWWTSLFYTHCYSSMFSNILAARGVIDRINISFIICQFTLLMAATLSIKIIKNCLSNSCQCRDFEEYLCSGKNMRMEKTWSMNSCRPWELLLQLHGCHVFPNGVS